MTDVLAIPAPARSGRTWYRRAGGWLTSDRSHRVVCVLLGLWLVNAFDVVLTIAAHRQGLLAETNPIAARLLLHSPLAVMVYKLTLVGFASTVLLIHRRQFIAEIAATGTLVIYIIVAVQWRLCYELYDVTFTSRIYLDGLDTVRAVAASPAMLLL